MPLNSTGTISLAGTTAGQSIALELGRSATAQISLNDSVVRTLAGVSSGAITMPTNFLGKSSVVAPTYVSGLYISGVAQVGQTLSVIGGSWTNSPTGYSYQWLRAGTSISGATGSQYVVTSADVGNGLACRVTASNAGGSNSVTSDYTNAVIVAAPTNTSAPTVSGTAWVGQTLSAGVGSWTGSPYQYIYEWLRAGGAISGATSSSYTITSSDIGYGLAVRVRAVNGGGSTPATSAYTSAVTVAPPTNTQAPGTIGIARVGEGLLASVGIWTGSPTFSFQWLRAGTSISGATSSAYTITNADLGNGLACRITATNGGGSVSVTTAYTSAVTAAVAKYGNAVISYSLGSGGTGGVDATMGGNGGTTTITYAGITLYAFGGSGGSYNNNAGGSGGAATGQGASASTGGNGGSVIGDVGGGGGGGINGGAGNGGGGGTGKAGGNAGDFSGFGTMIGSIGFSRGTGGAGASSASTSLNAMNGSPGGTIGAGGGGAGWYGGNGGWGGDGGGGGGGAAGFNAGNMRGGTGGQGLVFIRYYNSGSNTVIIRSSGTSYTLPSDTTSFEVWGIGGGGGGGGSTNVDGGSGSGGGAGGMIYRSYT